jgi:hypothetical protein
MIIASGLPVIGVLFWFAVAVAIVLGIVIFAKKASTLAVTFALVASALCVLLLWLMLRR